MSILSLNQLSKNSLDKIEQSFFSGGGNPIDNDAFCPTSCKYNGCIGGGVSVIAKSITLIVCIMLFGCHSGNQTVFDELILLDANQGNNGIDLLITDIADISYVPLQFGEENICISYYLPRSIFVYHDNIFLGDIFSRPPKLVTYNFNGEPIRIIGSHGRGPGEYLDLTKFIVDTLAKEVIIYDLTQRKFVVYGLDGIFKRERFLGNGTKFYYTAIENMNERYMLAYNNDSQYMSDKDIPLPDGRIYLEKNRLVVWGKIFTLYDKQTLEEVDFSNFEYARPNKYQANTILYGLTTTRDGIYIFSSRTDTIYFMGPDLRLTSKFRDITKYRDPNHEARLFPVIEGEQYIFFSTALENDIDNRNLRRFFAYDKKKDKLFRINTGLSEQLPFDSALEAIINNKVAFSQGMQALNHNYVVYFLTSEFLKEHYDNLPVDLQKIATQLQEDDNPVLMLMKLK